jgi:lipopolysaccharide/colanic/teichoic acid biosynthesis glycosyltransferase
MNNFYRKYLKRAFDFLFAFIALIVFFPVLLLVIILLKLTGHQRVFFVQPRVGKNQKIFKLIKLRTMTEAKDPMGNLLSDEKRLTKFGAMLRKSSLDELPQLINVLKGEMSLIGPRPLLIEYLPLYNAEQLKRHMERPGITGWAQVNGRNTISWEYKFTLDVWYIQHCSFLIDMKILFKTVQKILISEGISQAGQATAEPFRGS